MRRKHQRDKLGKDVNTAQTDETNSIPAGPGHRLKIARVAKNMSEEDVAKTLRLTKAVIVAIERDDYSGGTSFTFIRGYLRAYARLVNLPSDEVVQAFDCLGLVDSRPETAVVFESQQTIFSQDKSVKILVVVLMTLMILGLFVWLTSGSSRESVASSQFTSKQNSPPETDSNNPATAATSESGTLSKIAMQFSDECWVEVNDTLGKKLFVGMKQRGDDLKLQGVGPFKVLLGNPKAVKLSINQQLVDITQYLSASSSSIIIG